MVSVKLLSDDPCSHGNENFEILTVNIGHNSGYIKDSRNFWFHGKVFGVDQLKYAIRIRLSQSLVAMATTISKF